MLQGCLERAHQMFAVAAKALMRHAHRVSTRQGLEARRQVGGGRHLCIADKHRDDPLVLRQCRGDFEPDEVVVLQNAWLAVGGAGAHPALADDDQHDIAQANLLADHLDEIDARREVVDVDENLSFRKRLFQAVVEPPGEARRIDASIVDEDSAGQVRSLAPRSGVT